MARKEHCIIIKDDPYNWEVKTLKRLGNILFDKMGGRAYPLISARRIKIRKGNKVKEYVLLDDRFGAQVDLEVTRFGRVKVKDESLKVISNEGNGDIAIERDQTVLKLKTDPELVYGTIDSGLLLKLVRLKPTLGQVLAALVLGLIIGVIVGGALF